MVMDVHQQAKRDMIASLNYFHCQRDKALRRLLRLQKMGYTVDVIDGKLIGIKGGTKCQQELHTSA